MVSGAATTLKVGAEPEKTTDSVPSRLRSSTGVRVSSIEARRIPAGMVRVKGPAPPSASARV